MEQIHIPQTAEQKQKQKQLDEQRRQVLATFLQSDALNRLDRLQLVSPEKASRVEAVIYQMAETGQIEPQGIDEQRLKQMLEGLASSNQNGGLVVGGMQECDGAGKVVLQKRVEVLDNVRDLGDDDLSF